MSLAHRMVSGRRLYCSAICHSTSPAATVWWTRPVRCGRLRRAARRCPRTATARASRGRGVACGAWAVASARSASARARWRPPGAAARVGVAVGDGAATATHEDAANEPDAPARRRARSPRRPAARVGCARQPVAAGRASRRAHYASRRQVGPALARRFELAETRLRRLAARTSSGCISGGSSAAISRRIRSAAVGRGRCRARDETAARRARRSAWAAAAARRAAGRRTSRGCRRAGSARRR